MEKEEEMNLVEKEMPKDMERNQEVQDGNEVKNRGAKCSLI